MPKSSLSEPRLSGIIEGIEASLTLSGREVRVIVPAEVLEAEFEADNSPESWLATAERNALAIEQAARKSYSATAKALVILKHI